SNLSKVIHTTMTQNKGRRTFIKTASMGGAMALGLSQIVTSAYAGKKPGKLTLGKDDVISFLGDSVTDAGRNRHDKNSNSGCALGRGYAFMATSKLLHDHATKNLSVYNRGISGNKVYQLAERWDADCLELKPAVLSILIGVNDFWHMMNGKYTGTIDTYRNDYRTLLQRTKDKLPDVSLVIGEPFAVPGVKAVDSTWFPRFNAYREAARELADEFHAAFIPYQAIFVKAAKVA